MSARPIKELLDKFGIVPNDEMLYVEALTHSSHNATNSSTKHFDYERLEFLGDSLVGFVVGQLCYNLHPEMRQGDLSVLRSQFIRTEFESSISLSLGLQDYIQVGPSYTANPKDSLPLMEDVFESFIGALYLDQGFEKANSFLISLYYDKVKNGKIEIQENPKSVLQELLQADYKQSVTYRLLKESNEDNVHYFTMGAYFENFQLGEGKGKTKKEAEANAARDALTKKAYIGLKK